MWVGMLGNIPLIVSSEYIKTIKDNSRKISANYEEIKTIEGKPKLVFTGENLDTITFNMQLLSVFLVNLSKSVEDLERYCKNGEKIRFILGGKVVGNDITPQSVKDTINNTSLDSKVKDFFGTTQVMKNKGTGYWCITNIEEKQNAHSVLGTPISITLSVTLKEYN